MIEEDEPITDERSLYWNESVCFSINTTHLDNLESTEQDIEMSTDSDFDKEICQSIELIADEVCKKIYYNNK